MRRVPCYVQLFTRRAAALLYSNMRLQRWCFDVELLYLAEQVCHCNSIAARSAHVQLLFVVDSVDLGRVCHALLHHASSLFLLEVEQVFLHVGCILACTTTLHNAP